MNEWRDTTLGEVLTLQRGFDLPGKEPRTGQPSNRGSRPRLSVCASRRLHRIQEVASHSRRGMVTAAARSRTSAVASCHIAGPRRWRRCRSAAAFERASPTRSASQSAASSATCGQDDASSASTGSRGSIPGPRTDPVGDGHTGGGSSEATSPSSGAAPHAVGTPRFSAPSRTGNENRSACSTNSSAASRGTARRDSSYSPASDRRSSAR